MDWDYRTPWLSACGVVLLVTACAGSSSPLAKRADSPSTLGMEALTPDAALTLRLQTFDWETTEVEVVTLAPDGTVSVGRAAATDPRGPELAITHVASAQTRRRARELAASPAVLALPKIVTDPSTTDGWVLLLELRVREASRRFSFQNHVPAAAVPLIELLRAAGEVPTRDPGVQVR